MNEQQFKQRYKKAVDQMKPDDQMKKRIEQNMNVQRQSTKRPRKSLYIAVSVVVAAGIGLAAPTVWQQWGGTTAPSKETALNTGEVIKGLISDGQTVIKTENSNIVPVEIPKIEVPSGDNQNVKADMLGLVVYHGNVYTESATTVDAADALSLRGEKLGKTTGGIHELSGKDDYKDLASTIGTADIYTVNGYDSDFRIMSYTEIDGQVYAQLFDKTNGISISSGADLIGKLNIEGHVTAAQWESFDSWNNGLGQLQQLPVDESLNRFIEALYKATPVATSSELEERLYGKEDRKIIYLTLKDKTKVQLVLFGEEGMVRYGHVPVFFEVEQGAFQQLWNSLK
ncbi:hypothetical protein SAMN05720606_102185 [Paenibacillus polysaccharolyticus]|uniref:Uncharacterized protein n=1 Tax=Paenibacillus polysaccharolyticus TaxID=582692 RepID=A0A1G5CS34_9BACL|nr:hypothetical protein [Paenibacillus polysaccharolyticus]SCY05091.1 hypothetical protein SAMN05720606_102185 [Paenibacillus polysaccharolyticus]